MKAIFIQHHKFIDYVESLEDKNVYKLRATETAMQQDFKCQKELMHNRKRQRIMNQDIHTRNK